MELILNYDFTKKLDPATYVFQLGIEGPIQIGHTAALKERYETVQAANPYPVLIFGVKSFDSLAEAEEYERALHWICRDYRIHGDWFGYEAKALIAAHVDPMPVCLHGGGKRWRDVLASRTPSHVLAQKRRRRSVRLVLVPECIWRELVRKRLDGSSASAKRLRSAAGQNSGRTATPT